MRTLLALSTALALMLLGVSLEHLHADDRRARDLAACRDVESWRAWDQAHCEAVLDATELAFSMSVRLCCGSPQVTQEGQCQ